MNEMHIKGLVRTMLDGLKDASMQYEWAQSAHRSGDKKLASLHHGEAMKRLNGVKEWYEKSKSMMVDKQLDPIGDVLKSYFVDWYHDLLTKVTAMKV
jgi:secreted Zn-dependent insulinase-like peptidase